MKPLVVRQLMSTELVTLEEDENIAIADTIMNLARIRHLPVVRGQELVGLVTHRDILRAQASVFADFSASEDDAMKAAIPARDLMHVDVDTVSPDTSVLDAARILVEHKVGCLPVVEGRRLVGIITEADFVSLVIEALEEHSETKE